MADDAHAEEELDSWYDEEKEKITEQYVKKLYQIRVSTDENIPLQKKIDTDVAAKKYQNEFLAAAEKLRKKYKKNYNKIKDAQERKEASKKTKHKVFGPSLRVISEIKYYFMLHFGRGLKVVKWKHKNVKAGFYEQKEDIKHVKNKIVDFSIKPATAPIADPLHRTKRESVRPVKKRYEKFKLLLNEIRKVIDAIIQKVKELATNTPKKMTEVMDKFTKSLDTFFNGISKKKEHMIDGFKSLFEMIPVSNGELDEEEENTEEESDDGGDDNEEDEDYEPPKELRLIQIIRIFIIKSWRFSKKVICFFRDETKAFVDYSSFSVHHFYTYRLRTKIMPILWPIKRFFRHHH